VADEFEDAGLALQRMGRPQALVGQQEVVLK
jgi:hypothetical protein